MSQERIDQIDKELEEYEAVIKKIDLLKKERTKIEKLLKKEEESKLPFEKQFENFIGNGKICSDLFELESAAPLFKEHFVDDGWFDRYRTYEIVDMFEDTLSLVYETDQERLDMVKKECEEEKEDYEEYMNKLRAIAKEIMKNKIRGWVQDW